MYTKGDIYIDEARRDQRNNQWEYGKKAIQLPHSCDEWIIGTPLEALTMIEDLKIAIENYARQKS